MRSSLTYLVLVCSLAVSLQGRTKTDVLVMKNGDRITCEIKSLSMGQLTIKTSYTIGSIPVNWDKVERIESQQLFRFDLGRGEHHAGTFRIEPSAAEGERVVIAGEGSEIDAKKSEVVQIGQLGQSFLARLDGGISSGFSFTKANNQTSLAVNGNVRYQTAKSYFETTLSTNHTGQREGVSTKRSNVTVNWLRYLRRRGWFGLFYNDYLISDQQQLDLRATIGGGLGRDLIHTNRTILRALGGSVFTREKYAQESGLEPKQSNVEIFTAVNFAMFRFDSTEITANARVFPSVSNPGRVRLDSDVGLKLDLIGDLYWNVSLYGNFDSSPPVQVSGSDYGVNTTIGWSF